MNTLILSSLALTVSAVTIISVETAFYLSIAAGVLLIAVCDYAPHRWVKETKHDADSSSLRKR